MRIFLVVIFLLFSVVSFSQTETFNFSDLEFKVGQTKKVEFFYSFCHPWYNENEEIENEIVAFLLAHNYLKIELGAHTDSRGSFDANHSLTEKRTKAIRERLIKKGVDSSQITFKGYGESNPIITEDEVNKLTSSDEKEKAHQKNRRTELKITHIGKRDFSWMVIEGQIMDDTLKIHPKYSTIKLISISGAIKEVNGDSLGRFKLVMRDSLGLNNYVMLINGDKIAQYKHKFREVLLTDSTYFELDQTFKVAPGIRCADSFLPDDILFEKNQWQIEPDSRSMVLGLIESFKTDYPQYLTLKVSTYSGFDERSKISTKRYKEIYSFFAEKGFPMDRLKIEDMGHSDFLYRKYKNGCYQYHLFNKEPININKDLVESHPEGHDFNKLRRRVEFNWIYTRNEN